MRKKIGLYLLFFLIIIFDSCRGKGKWDDNIHLSIRYVEFSASGDSITIKTLGSAWWIGDISVDDKWYSGFASIDQIHTEKYSIIKDCVDVKRLDKNTFTIKVEANPNTVNRIITVGLEAGDYGDRVTITQKSK